MSEKKTPTDQAHPVPRTLLEAVRYFADEDVAHSFAASMRWPDGPTCSRCGCKEYSYISTRKLWKCKNKECRYQYSAKKGTIFEDSPLGFDKWLPAIWLLVNAKNGISSHELARALGIHQESAWHMLGRIRLALEVGSFEKLSGEVEADETFVGGQAKFMHQATKKRKGIGRGRPGMTGHKTVVMGILERGGEVRASVIPSVSNEIVREKITRHVEPGTTLMTDSYRAYDALAGDFDRQVIDHAESYVRGRVHTNGIENFWSLMKRALKGTYISVQPDHLQRYVTEEVWRFNARHDVDGGRFVEALRGTEGKRLTYRDLTSKG